MESMKLGSDVVTVFPVKEEIVGEMLLDPTFLVQVEEVVSDVDVALGV